MLKVIKKAGAWRPTLVSGLHVLRISFKFNIGMALREAIVLANRVIFSFAKGSTIAPLLILTYVAYICARYFFQEKFRRSPHFRGINSLYMSDIFNLGVKRHHICYND